MREQAIDLLKKLTNAHAVSGHENEVRRILIDSLQGKGELQSDKLGSICCHHGKQGPKVLLTAHMDEIGFLVQHVTEHGFIQIVPVGGWWTHNLLSQRVHILNTRGEKILGIISSKPLHFLPEPQRKSVIDIEHLFVDVGASSRQEVIEQLHIQLGCPIAPASEFTAAHINDVFIAKAFDNRVGMACLIQAYHILIKQDHPNRLIAAGSVQEEVGLRGAKPLAQLTQPDVAIVLEGPPADDSPGFARSTSQASLGKGVQIRLYDPTSIANPQLAQFVIDTAKDAGIDHQVAVRRTGGTDAGSIHLANTGVPTIVLGTPARYIHSHNSMIHINDYLNMVKLSVELVSRLDETAVKAFSYHIPS